MSDKTGQNQARILADALPFMQRYEDKIIVIKYGGAAMETERMKLFARDVVLLKQSGVRPVIVHGGGKQINHMLERLNIKPEFYEGLRITSQQTAEIVEMVLAGQINKKITDQINRAGSKAVGLSGRDAKLVMVKEHHHEKLGFVGQPDQIDPTIILTLLEAGMIPVIAPTASDNKGHIYNINADIFAGAIAAALTATRLIILTDVPGLMDKQGNLIPSLTIENAQNLLINNIATDGMRPKIETCIQAIRKGVKGAFILDGRQEHALLLELFTPHGVGTMIQSRP